jgi:hypothetical protein
MFDCAEDVTAYHDDKVTLPQAERDEMRGRRDANRDRLRAGLAKNEKPKPVEIASQGSYSMRTMVQHTDKDYDIDDGAYFAKEELIGPKGGEMSALETRQMVRDALAVDGRFKKEPEVRDSCVRVFYDEGYRIDVPAYRRTKTKDALGVDTFRFELAGPDWRESDARAVTRWFEKRNEILSPDKENGRQFRRVVRLAKKFGRSRDTWKGRMASGFMITKLCSDCFQPASERDDVALRRTLEAVRDRLKSSLVVQHPVLLGETISKGNNDPKAAFLRDKLEENLEHLKTLDEPTCDHEQALKAWGDFFNDPWFRGRAKEPDKAGAAFIFGTTGPDRPAVDKQGGGRYA